MTTTFVLHAMARGIEVRALSTELEGDLDLHGLLGLDDSVSPGYREIRIRMHVDADCTEDELADRCNTICRPVPVRIERVA